MIRLHRLLYHIAGCAPVPVRGMVLIVYEKIPDGSWNWFRGQGSKRE